jgi:uncharacterized membrane protein
MRALAIFGLSIYGLANLFAGIFNWATIGSLPTYVNATLLLSGVVFLFAVVSLARRARYGRFIAILSLVLASALAGYNERVLGLGHPSHHLIPGAYTLLVLWAVIRATQKRRQKNMQPN